VDAHEKFGAPTYKWLPAKSRMRTRFLFFYCSVPSGFTAVSDVIVEDGKVKIKDKSGVVISLNARLPL
jgi:hypothetical protein